MTPRQLLCLTVITLLLGLVLSAVLPLLAAAYQPYPPMSPGQSIGSIIGRVTDAGGTGIAGAGVYLVNTTDTNILYASGRTDSDGYYVFSGVNSSGGKAAYLVYANATGYSDASSGTLAVESGGTCNVATLTLGGTGPTLAPTPTPIKKPGNVSGYVTVSGSGEAISNATVTLVDAPDMFTVYGSTRTGTDGRYCLEGVEAMAAPGYRLHVEKSGYREAYSLPFTVNQGAAVKVNVTLNETPTANTGMNPTGTVATVTPVPLPSSSRDAGSSLPGVPGFEFVAAIACLTIACAIARKQ